MTIDIDNGTITEEYVFDLITTFENADTEIGDLPKVARMKARTLRLFLSACASKGITDSTLIPVDVNNYVTGNQLIELMASTYSYVWLSAEWGAAGQLSDIYLEKSKEYFMLMNKLKGELNADLILNGDAANATSYWGIKPIGGLH